MKKRLVALLCVVGLVLVPSMGVMAAEPEAATEEQAVVEQQIETKEQETSVNEPPVTEPQETNENQQNVTEQTPVIESNKTEGGENQVSENVPGVTSEETVEQTQTEEEKKTEEGNQGGTLENTVPENGTKAPEKAVLRSSRSVQQDSGQIAPQSANENQAAVLNNEQTRLAIMVGLETYELTDGKIQNKEGHTINGVEWDEESNSLYFKNVKLTVPEGQDKYNDITIAMMGDISLILIGDNCLVAKNGSIAVMAQGNLNIQGGGTLNADSMHSSIAVDGNTLNIRDVEINLNSSSDEVTDILQGIYLMNETTTFNNNANTASASQGSINITDSTVQGKNMPIVAIGGGINFKGKSVVKATGIKGMPGILAEWIIHFALTEGGKVTGIGGELTKENAFPFRVGIVSIGGFKFDEGNNIIDPINGIVKSFGEGDEKVYFIANPDGSPAGTAIVAGPAVKEITSEGPVLAANTTIVKNGLKSAGVKTGDTAQAGVWLVLFMAAAGCAAVVIRAKKAQ